MQDALSRLGVTTIDVVGIATDYCVLASALDAVAAGCTVRVFSDLVAGVAPESSTAALERLASAGVIVVDSTLGDARDIASLQGRGQGLRLGVALVVAGLVIGAIVAVGTVVVGGFAQTEEGLCRITWAPCTELSLGSVEALSGVQLPDGTEVVSGFSRESERTPEFRAEVTLPPGARFSLSTAYGELDGAQPGLVRALSGLDLTEVRYWTRFEQASGSMNLSAK